MRLVAWVTRWEGTARCCDSVPASGNLCSGVKGWLAGLEINARSCVFPLYAKFVTPTENGPNVRCTKYLSFDITDVAVAEVSFKWGTVYSLAGWRHLFIVHNYSFWPRKLAFNSSVFYVTSLSLSLQVCFGINSLNGSVQTPLCSSLDLSRSF